MFMTPKICVQASNLSYHLHKSHYTLIPKRFKDCVQALVHPPPFTNPHCTLTPKDRKFQRFCTSSCTPTAFYKSTLYSPKIQRLCTRSHASATFYKFTLYLLFSGGRGAAVCDGSWHPDVLASRYLKNLHNGLTSSSGGMWGYYKK